MTVTDLSDHQTVTLPGGGGMLTHVLDGMVLSYRAEGTPMDLANFGRLYFTNATIDDQNLFAARAIPLYMNYPISPGPAPDR